MRSEVLVDAGPLIAILDRADAEHERCVQVLKKLQAPLATTWAPLVEAMYMLESQPAQDALLAMVQRGELRILHLDSQDVPALRILMDKYQDLPMDLADATLVRIAQRDGFSRVFTLDVRDFSIYRGSRGRPFTILPKVS